MLLIVLFKNGGFPGGSVVKNLPAKQEMWVQSLSLEDPLEKEMTTHSSILARGNPMDRGAWQAAVSGVTKSQTWISNYTAAVEFKNGDCVESSVRKSVVFFSRWVHAWLCDPKNCSKPGFPVLHYPRVCSNSHPFNWWCHLTISSSVVPFSSCLQTFPKSGSFTRSQFFASGGQSIGVSASASVLPMNIQDLFPLGWTGWIALQSKGLSRVFSSTTIQKHQWFGSHPSLWSNSHIHTWLLEKP